MKITVGGSMVFAKEQLRVKKQLEQAGHEVLVTDNIENFVNQPAIKQSFKDELKMSQEFDIMRSFFKKIEVSDALLICNYPKSGIEGYLGASVLMELGLAHYLNKKIFLLFDVDKAQGYALEVAIINPQVLQGDVSKII